jgi:putative transcriptional regulator
MARKAFDKIAKGLNEALAIAKGEAQPARLYVPPEIDVKAIRQKLGLSQDDFAAYFGFTIDQIKAWEQRRARPLGGLRAYLMLIGSNPEQVRSLLLAATKEGLHDAVAVDARHSRACRAHLRGRRFQARQERAPQ